MGCAASRVDIDARVLSSKERKQLIKQLVEIRREFADAQFTYLRSLKNMGVALRQFTDSASLEQESTPSVSEAPSSLSSPLPPSPPPPPPFSPNSTLSEDDERKSISQEDDNDDSPSPPAILTKLDSFTPSSPDILLPAIEDQNHESQSLSEEPWKKKSVHCIIRELDEHFLQAFDSGSSVAVLMDASIVDSSHQSNDLKGKKMNSKNVLSAFSWSRSSRSMRSMPKDLSTENTLNEPCNPGSNHLTLAKIHNLEQTLYKLVKEEEVVKLEHDKKLILLQKQDGNLEDPKLEKLRSSMEEVGSKLSRLQNAIITTTFSIIEAIDVELYPQVVAIASGMKFMWTKMSECHETQTEISKYLTHLTEDHLPDLTTEYHKHATFQLETEVNIWLASFEKLVKFQNEYAEVLSRWVRRADSLRDGRTEKGYSSAIGRFCDEWHEACSKLPDKVVWDAMKSLGNGVGAIMRLQEEESWRRKKCEKMQRRMEKEENTLGEMETGGKYPLGANHARLEALRKEVALEKANHLRCLEATRAITLNKLTTSLPLLFRALMDFSMAYANLLEPICLNEDASYA